MPPTLAEHGTYGRYTAGCRCVECRAWNAAKARARRARARGETPTAPPTAPNVGRAGTPAPAGAFGPVETAARGALGVADDRFTRVWHEILFRGARNLDDPDNARHYAATATAMRAVLRELDGPDVGAVADLADAIRAAGRGD